MGVVADIAASYRRPKEVFARRVAGDERTALATLIFGCALMFISRWPVATRAAQMSEVPLDAQISAAIFTTIFIMPLVMYLFAGALFFGARIFRISVAGVALRNAVFWAFMATSPLGLLYGLVQGFFGSGTEAFCVGFICFGAFVAFLTIGLNQAAGLGKSK